MMEKEGMAGWWQEQEVSGHIVSTVRKQGEEMAGGAQLTHCVFCTGPQCMGWYCPGSWQASPPQSNLETPSETSAEICFHSDSGSLEVDIPD